MYTLHVKGGSTEADLPSWVMTQPVDPKSIIVFEWIPDHFPGLQDEASLGKRNSDKIENRCMVLMRNITLKF